MGGSVTLNSPSATNCKWAYLIFIWLLVSFTGNGLHSSVVVKKSIRTSLQCPQWWLHALDHHRRHDHQIWHEPNYHSKSRVYSELPNNRAQLVTCDKRNYAAGRQQESTSEQGHCSRVSLAIMARSQVVLLLLLVSLVLVSADLAPGSEYSDELEVIRDSAEACEDLCTQVRLENRKCDHHKWVENKSICDIYFK